MIVIAIIGILAAIATPAYQDYIARAQASEGVSLAGGLKVAVIDENLQNNTCYDPIAAENSRAGKYALAVVSGTYTATATNVANNPTGCVVTVTYGSGTAGANVAKELTAFGNKLVLNLLVNGSFKNAEVNDSIPPKYLPKAVQ
jgi:type IV pilus assembly protein PilA